jgi:superfamily I DNA/RNA helicase
VNAELSDELPPDYRNHHLRVCSMLELVAEGQMVEDDDRLILEDSTGILLEEIIELLGPKEPAEDADEETKPDDGGEEPSVLVTTLTGAKGLQAPHVFVVGLMDGHFPRQDLTEEEVCKLIVALTRATKTCTLMSTRRFSGGEPSRRSPFLEWLKPILDEVYVNKAYWG